MSHLKILRERLLQVTNPLFIKTQGGVITVTPICQEGICLGVNVDKLGNSPFIPFDVFVSVISLLNLSPENRAIKGSAQGGRLGSPELPIYSVEGHVAIVVYGKEVDESVFQRITPISRILEWAGVCINGRGWLQLVTLKNIKDNK